jgi:uncharacterized protein YegP (UPF0339 family)
MKKRLRVQIYLNKKKEFCFRILAGNNKIIAIGESYKSRRGVMKTVKLIEGLNIWDIKDLTA